MKKVLIAFGLSAIVLPGLGQLYNRQKLKGVLLILFTVFIFFVFNIFLVQLIQPTIINDPSKVNIKIISDAINQLRLQYPKPFDYYGLLVMFLWAYASIDAMVYAYLNQKKSQNSVANSEPHEKPE